MKKTFLLIIFQSLFTLLNAQPLLYHPNLPPYDIKAAYIRGNILKHTAHLQNIVQNATEGIELMIEFHTFDARKDWHKFFHHPRIGLGTTWMDLGNKEQLGQLLAVYPYLSFQLFELKGVSLNMRTGAGMSYLNKTFKNTQFKDENGWVILNQSNAAIGSHINVYFAAGGEIDFPVTSQFGINAGFFWNHASNGSMVQPNSGINILNTTIGLRYSPQFYQSQRNFPEKSYPDLPRRWGTELIISGGVRELYFRDEQQFATGAITWQINRTVSNRMRAGIALDGFYDGVYASVNSSPVPGENRSTYKRTYLTEDLLINRFRVGISLQPEFIFGKLIVGFHFGTYIFNPIKYLEPFMDAKNGLIQKGIFYAYDIEKEDGWFYTRASMKYEVTRNLFLHVGLKTHLQKAEFIEWGLGLRFPGSTK